MKMKVRNILKYLLLMIIPIISVVLCMVFRLAQGERIEEIVFGVMLGILLDFIYSIVLLFVSRISNKAE